MDVPFLVLDLVLFLTGTKNPGKISLALSTTEKTIVCSRGTGWSPTAIFLAGEFYPDTLRYEGDYGMVIVSG